MFAFVDLIELGKKQTLYFYRWLEEYWLGGSAKL